MEQGLIGYSEGYIDGVFSQQETIESQKQMIKELHNELLKLKNRYVSPNEDMYLKNSLSTTLEKAKQYINGK